MADANVRDPAHHGHEPHGHDPSDHGHERHDDHHHDHHSDEALATAARGSATEARTAAREAKARDDEAKERRQARRLLLVLVVIGCFFFVELFGARAAHSDVLQADAYHLLMDVFALAISLVAMRLATAKPSARFTYGLRRVEPLAALVNGVLVLGVALELVRDSIEHMQNTNMPRSGLMLVVATGALIVNGFSAWVIHGAMHQHGGHSHGGHSHGEHSHAGHAHADHAHDGASAGEDDEGHHAHAHAHHLNLRGAWLHLLGDALGSCSAFAAGLLIRFGVSPIVDPLASFLVVTILVVGAFRLVRDAGLVLLDAAPSRLPVARVRKLVQGFPGVQGIHALHVWSLGTGHDAVTVHVTSDDANHDLATRLGDVLRTRFRAEYVTVQVERPLTTLSVDHPP